MGTSQLIGKIEHLGVTLVRWYEYCAIQFIGRGRLAVFRNAFYTF